MPAPLNALQAGFYQRLTGYSGLSGVGVYDYIPQGTKPPYIVIGDDTMNEYDTQTGNGFDCTVMIHCWHFLTSGRKAVKSVMSAIYDALHNQEPYITVDGFSLTRLYCEFQQSFQDVTEEGDTDHFYHGVMRFRAIISTINS
jgi:hypothetical protein